MIWWQFLIKRCLIYIHAYGGYSLLHLSPLKTKICIHLHFYCWNEASHPAAAVRSTRNRKDHLENSCRNYHPCYSPSAVDAPRQSPPLVMAWFIESQGRRGHEYKLCAHRCMWIKCTKQGVCPRLLTLKRNQPSDGLNRNWGIWETGREKRWSQYEQKYKSSVTDG